MKKLVSLLIVVVLFCSCSDYQKALKNEDVAAKFEIATKMYVTEDAIKWHMRKIFAILNVKSRTQAIIEAERQGVI